MSCTCPSPIVSYILYMLTCTSRPLDKLDIRRSRAVDFRRGVQDLIIFDSVGEEHFFAVLPGFPGETGEVSAYPLSLFRMQKTGG